MAFARLILTTHLVFVLSVVSVYAQDSKENAEFKLALNLYNDGMYELALEQLKQFVAAYPSSVQGVEARFYLGQCHLKLKQYEEARLAFQTFALTYQDNPNAPEAWLNVGKSYEGLGNKKEAALAYERVKVFHPKSPQAAQALIESARLFKESGQPDDARRVLRIVLQEYSSSPLAQRARTALGEVYFEEGNFAQAEEELKRVIQGDPSPDARAQALLVLGDIYRKRWQLDEARTQYEEIVTKHKGASTRGAAHLQLGHVFMGLGKFQDAADHFSKATAEKSLLDSAMITAAELGLAEACEGQQDYLKALAQYERVLNRLPSEDSSRHEILFRIAVAHGSAKNYARGSEALQRILSSNPSDSMRRRVLARLASYAEYSNNAGEAIRIYGMFLESYPADPHAPVILWKSAQLLMQTLNDLRRAAYVCESLMSRFPESPLVTQAYMLAAECYDKLRDFDHAMAVRRALLVKYPAADSFASVRARMNEIETFEAKNKDAALEKLALLLGDVLTERSRSDLTFRLGETYFHDLKNYQAAIAQFTAVINSGVTGKPFEDALFYRAKSYEYLSKRDPSYRAQAIDSYMMFLNAYPSDPRSGDAAYSLFMLKSTSPEEAKAAYESFAQSNPNDAKRADMLLRIGALQEKADKSTALATFTAILVQHGGSEAAEEARYHRFRILLELGMTDSAVAEGNRFVSRYPNARFTAAVTDRLAELALSLRDYRSAVRHLTVLFERFRYYSAAQGVEQRLADAHTLAGEYDKAIALYNELIDFDRDDPFGTGYGDSHIRLRLAGLYRHAGQSTKAREILAEVLSTVHSNSLKGEAFLLLGNLAQDGGDRDFAASYFRQAASVSPGTAATRDVADLLFEAGAYSDAINQYRLLAQSASEVNDRKYFEARIILARLKTDDLETARKEISVFSKTYKNIDNELGAFELERGNFFFRKGDYSSAFMTYTNVLDRYDDTPSVPEAMYGKGKALEAQGRAKEATKTLEELLKEYPTARIIQRARIALGNIAYNGERWDDAIRYYKSAAEDPKIDHSLLPFAMGNLIEAYEAAGIFDAALDWTRKYLDRFPSNEDSFDKQIKVGILYQRLGFNDQSIQHLQGLLDKAGSELEGEIRYYIAEANFQKGDYQQAVLDFLKVPYLVTKKGKLDWTANSFYMAGQSYERMGRHDQALAMYQQIVDRPGIDQTFKAAAAKEIDRVKLVLKKGG
jgi:TolA-binding protein